MWASRSRLPALAAALGVAVAAGACAPKTSITQVWSAQVPAGHQPMHKIVVVSSRIDEANRRVLEDAFVGALRGRGVEAIPGYKLFPEGVPDPTKAKATVESLGADGILAATYRGTRQKVSYTPGSVWGGAYAWGGWGYYDGYVTTDELVSLETTLWDARAADTVVWSALTTTKNPSSGQEFVKSVTEKVVPAMAGAGFLPPRLDQ
jgi:hypothetical protein